MGIHPRVDRGWLNQSFSHFASGQAKFSTLHRLNFDTAESLVQRPQAQYTRRFKRVPSNSPIFRSPASSISPFSNRQLCATLHIDVNIDEWEWLEIGGRDDKGVAQIDENRQEYTQSFALSRSYPPSDRWLLIWRTLTTWSKVTFFSLNVGGKKTEGRKKNTHEVRKKGGSLNFKRNLHENCVKKRINFEP